MSQVIENKDVNITMLKKRSDFLRVAGLRKKWISKAMVVQVAAKPSGEKEGIRVGYTASKKVGNAILRNKAKRRLREVVKKVMAEDAKLNYDYVIIARKEITEYPFNELIRDMKWCLRKLHDDKSKKS
ncbi:MAG: ribonuclease P protein component [Kordiimonadaceae bacterium]|jgi:ribonuclease P protein component|nr:ribonuclease P protein component [Kordiimonadaceae bacterium]MBT6032779.1 ribonuclease P protein component [Kordiimonadaceae bacterium]